MGPSKSELWPSKGACYLCGVAGPLCRSHIIPKFVGDWLRSTNITGRLRNSSAPNRLVQDLEWRYLLCQACELRFSKFESEVSEKIFLPIHERKQDRFRYGQSFALFAVSVAWRGLIVLRREEALGHLSDVASQVEAAERVWREFLLGRLATPAPHVVHALPMDVPTNLDVTGRPPHFARFLLRAPAIGTRLTESGGYVVIKLARLFIFGTVASGTERRVWKATQIHPGGGSWGVEEYHVPGWVDGFLNLGAQRLQESGEQLSSRQKRVTNKQLLAAVDQNVAGVANSDLMSAFEADLRLFGKIAFQPPFPDDDSA